MGDVEEDDDDDDSGEEEGETESEASGPESSPVKVRESVAAGCGVVTSAFECFIRVPLNVLEFVLNVLGFSLILLFLVLI